MSNLESPNLKRITPGRKCTVCQGKGSYKFAVANRDGVPILDAIDCAFCEDGVKYGS